MKHLLSFVAALAATAALLLTLPGTARANSTATTIPNPSGHLTCTGTNPDGSDAAWTVGGNIYFTSDYSNPPAHLEDGNGNYLGYHNIKPSINSNPYGGTGNASCTWQIMTLSNVQSGCTRINGSLDLYFTSYSNGKGQQNVILYRVPNPVANSTYNMNSIPLSFAELDDVNNVQYKVTSAQGGPTLGTVATSYL